MGLSNTTSKVNESPSFMIWPRMVVMAGHARDFPAVQAGYGGDQGPQVLPSLALILIVIEVGPSKVTRPNI